MLHEHDGASPAQDSVTREDRRRFPRMPLNHPVVCLADGERIVARVRSISGDGMLLETEHAFGRGAVFEVRIGPPLTGNRMFRAQVSVVRVDAVEASRSEPVVHGVAVRISRLLTPLE